MRRCLFFLFFVAVSMIAKAQFTIYEPVIPDNSRSVPFQSRNYGPFSSYTPSETIVRGTTYNATVYYESSTGHENTYRLPVVVNNGSVNKICFDNGGSVHIGINNSGYKYYGGDLEYIRDIDGYATVVTIIYSNDSWQKFTVVIQ